MMNKTVLLAMGMALMLTGCASAPSKQADPKVSNYLSHQVGRLSLDSAILHWGSPKFFTQQGEKRVAVWRSVKKKNDYGQIINRVDPIGAYSSFQNAFHVARDTGWELRVVFDHEDTMADWRYMEW